MLPCFVLCNFVLCNPCNYCISSMSYPVISLQLPCHVCQVCIVYFNPPKTDVLLCFPLFFELYFAFIQGPALARIGMFCLFYVLKPCNRARPLSSNQCYLQDYMVCTLYRESHPVRVHNSADLHQVAGMNCIEMGLPGKLILSKRKGLREVLFS